MLVSADIQIYDINRTLKNGIMPSLVSSHTDCHKKYNLRVPTVKQRDYFGSYLLCDSRKIYSFHNLRRWKKYKQM